MSISTVISPCNTPPAGGNGQTLEFPTVVRTGTGSIDIVAAGDIDWQDSTAPAAVYTAGAPAAGTTTGTGVTAEVFPSNDGVVPDLLVNGLVNPANAGNVVLSAGGNINGIEQVYDTTGSITGTPGTFIGQFWWPWLETGNVSATSSRPASINFANFDQGVMSVGGNVTVTAGGNISDLSVSLPTTWYANAADTAITTVGGGNLTSARAATFLAAVISSPMERAVCRPAARSVPISLMCYRVVARVQTAFRSAASRRPFPPCSLCRMRSGTCKLAMAWISRIFSTRPMDPPRPRLG
jgi:hypothetical protein